MAITITRPVNDVQYAPYAPQYELRIRRHGASDNEMELWQLPGPATPHLRAPRRIAGLRGRNLDLVEHRLLKQLRRYAVDPAGLLPGEERRSALPEEEALRLGLLFRVLAPMRNRSSMDACVAGIEAMPVEEAAYWLGMAMYRRYPRRVLTALRVLLIDPRQSSRARFHAIGTLGDPDPPTGHEAVGDLRPSPVLPQPSESNTAGPTLPQALEGHMAQPPPHQPSFFP